MVFLPSGVSWAPLWPRHPAVLVPSVLLSLLSSFLHPIPPSPCVPQGLLNLGSTTGFVKIIVSKPFGEILGAHIIGADASELIHEFCLAIRLEATAEDIISTMHAHPTMSESIHEAALDTENRVINS